MGNKARSVQCGDSHLLLAFQYIFTSVDMLEGMEMFGKYAVLVLWAAANLFFFIYDYALTQLTDMYINWFRKKYSEENDGDVFMNEEQEKEILNEAKIQTARHKKKYR